MYKTISLTPILNVYVHFTNIWTPNDLDNESFQNVEIFMANNGSLAPKRYNYTQLEKITKSFTDKLGQGGCGSVYKGTLPDDRFVAVKVLNETKSNGEEFINEVASISKTSHVNIVNLLGFCYEKNKRALIYEFMPNKSLDKFICKSSIDCHLAWDNMYKIALGVARGLEYLHRGCNTRIVHFDIKPQNILLGTTGYIAPEVFSRNFGAVSHKSDVYSYGMTILEMLGARKISEVEAVKSSESYFLDKVYEQGILNKTKELNEMILSDEEEETERKMFLIGFWCIQTNPSDRPSMSKVVEMFEGSLESICIPPKPLLSSPTLSGQQFSSTLPVDLTTETSLQGYLS
ncbi:hypothetical protein RD792_006802 [Penstemon davidsonii]|uniref:Protein kinase domain-containing protein n=1 Tax=Penstemon davidsonii TaxID=160366 RepID=A0ABR0DBM6_9LAMI|nr:hypothetical protein RD792_006802 [Penstemon davidsonii]